MKKLNAKCNSSSTWNTSAEWDQGPGHVGLEQTQTDFFPWHSEIPTQGWQMYEMILQQMQFANFVIDIYRIIDR